MLDMDRIGLLLESRRNDGGTHWDECVYAHVDCAVVALVKRVTKLEGGLRQIAEGDFARASPGWESAARFAAALLDAPHEGASDDRL